MPKLHASTYVRILLLTVLFALVSVPAFSAMVTQTACSVNTRSGTVSTADPLLCNVIGPDGADVKAKASAGVGPALPLGFGLVTSLDLSSGPVFSSAIVGQTGVFTFFGSSASASLLWSLTALSVGPVRPGIILLSLGASGVSSDGMATAGAGVGPYSATSTNSGACAGNCGLGPLPFTLGVPFGLSINDSVFSQSSNPSIVASVLSTASSRITFSLFEADGVTPVRFAPVPEPATFLLTAVVLCVFAVIGRFDFRERARRR